MIKPKSLMPGRVMSNKRFEYCYTPAGKYETCLLTTTYMILTVELTVKRRHSKKTAANAGWDLHVLRFGSNEVNSSMYKNRLVEKIHISQASLKDWTPLF